MSDDYPIDVALRYMLRSGEQITICTPDGGDEPAFVFKPFKQEAQVVVLVKATFDTAFVASSTFNVMVMKAHQAAFMNAAQCREDFDCIVCGARIGTTSVFAALCAENCLKNDKSALPDVPTAFVFAHCPRCRDEAHWRATFCAATQFSPRSPVEAPPGAKVSTHVSHEALCAAVHREQLSVIFRHPYAHTSFNIADVVDHRSLPMYERRCAARECGKLFTHNTEYRISSTEATDGRKTTMAVSMLHCLDNTCRDSATREIANMLTGDKSGSQLPFETVFVNSKVFPRSERVCASCSQPGNLLYCAGCRGTVYCSPACQRKEWKTHRKLCGMIRKHVSAAKAKRK